MIKSVAAALSCGVCVVAIATPAEAQTREYRIPAGSLKSALDAYARQSGRQIIYKLDEIQRARSSGASGNMTAEAALAALLAGTGFKAQGDSSGAIAIVQTNIAGSPSAGEAIAGSAAAENESANDIVVTGSRLRRKPGEGASPVITIGRAEIERQGASNIGDVLRNIPQAPLISNETGLTSFNGQSNVQLRGLPTGTTLILVNGRRTVASPVTNAKAFDLNGIPLAAVERVEVLSDSASAVYGADAIAGVINIVLKNDFKGAQVDLRYGSTEDNRAVEKQGSVTLGGATGNARGMLVFDWLDRSPLLSRDRDRTANADYRRFGGTDYRATYYAPRATIYALPGSGNLPGLNSTFAAVPAGSTGIGLSPSDFIAGQKNLGSPVYSAIIPEAKRLGIIANGEITLAPTVEFFADLLFSRNITYSLSEPAAVSGGAFGIVQVPANNPFNPFGVPVGIDYLLTGAPPYKNTIKTDSGRFTAGLRGQFGRDWHWESALMLTQQWVDSSIVNAPDQAKIRQVLSETDPAKTINVFKDGPGASPETLASVLGGRDDRFKGGSRHLLLQADGSLFDLPGGRVQLAVGGEIRRETLQQKALFANIDASRNVESVYIEALAPLSPAGTPGLGRLDLTLAARYDHYSDFGGTLNPKVGLEWSPLAFATFRATYGTAFKAPTLPNLYAATMTNNYVVLDPRRNESALVAVRTGGSPNLNPETGKSLNLGVVFNDRVIKNLNLSIDYWQVKLNHRVVVAPYTSLIANEDQFADRISRAPPTPADIAAGRPGGLIAIDATTLNFGSIDIRGIDIRSNYKLDTKIGEFLLAAAATYTDKYTAVISPSGPPQNRRGKANFDGFAPEWKGVASIDWDLDGFSAGLNARYISSYEDYVGTNRLGALTTFDLRAAYKFAAAHGHLLDGVRLSGGILNIFEEAPKFSNIPIGYDPFMGDLRGRYFYLQLSKKF